MARRSLLFSPGDRPEMLRKAPTTGADVLIFDLEDAVAPGRKAAARETVRELLSDPAFDPDCEVCVRVNAGDAGDADVDALEGVSRLDSAMVPKADDPAAVDRVAGRLAAAGHDVGIFALIETAAGVLAAADVARADATDALCFGAEDLTADLGASRTPDRTEVLYARERVVVAARAAGVDAVDTICPDVEDLDGLAEETAFARSLGYDGKMVVHPAQVPVVNGAFAPDPDDVEWAERVMDAAEAASAAGEGAFRVDGEMIDAPLVAQAERILERAESGRG